ncbi:unnamed protein product [Owenia fusiformis]|uniref:Uncharacterized protein n=1 Tax=Owenia fusiformis TaxID=6347 RepID=A0A8S4P6N7_OWEFU|nr:unnamed protein product [Owenia fusiformis]
MSSQYRSTYRSARSAREPTPEKPALLRKLRDKTASEGGSITFETKLLRGTPKPDVTWLKDGKEISNDDHYQMTYDGETCWLNVKSLSSADDGEYSCTLTNSEGSVKTACHLMVEGASKYGRGSSKTSKVRAQKPEFIIKPRRQFVDEDQAAKFKASFEGSPTPTIQWSKGGNVIEESDKYKLYELRDYHFLEIKDCSIEDQGEYLCTITNDSGKDEQKAKLEVYEKPKPKMSSRVKKVAPEFESKLSHMTVKEGESVTLECTAIGTPEPTMKWYKDGNILKSSTDFKQTFDGKTAKLVINEILTEDAGKYECLAINNVGENRTYCRVKVEEVKKKGVPPTLEGTLSDQTVTDGDTVILECNVTGDPKPDVKWMHDGKPIKSTEDFKISYDGTVAKLEIMEVFPEDSGEYCCIISNSAGEVKTSSHIVVEEKAKAKKKGPEKRAPYFIQEFEPEYEVMDGTTVELIVRIGGTAPLDVIWLHNNKEIKKSSDIYKLTSQGDTYKLQMEEVFPEDAGSWVCEVYNDVGDVDTACKLIVKEEESAPTPAPTKPTPTKTTPTKQMPTKVSPAKTDINSNPPVPESGSQDDGFEETVSPEFIRKPRSLDIDEGTCAKFTCQVDAAPMATMVWSKDGKPVEDSARIKIYDDGIDTYTLEIPHCLSTDEGRYACVATNFEGSDKCSFGLKVRPLQDGPVDFRDLLKSKPGLKILTSGESTESEPQEKEPEQLDFRHMLKRHVKTKKKPEFLTNLEDVRVNDGDVLILECKVEGIPEPDIKWYFGKEELKEGDFTMSYDKTVAHLELDETLPEDAGEYICVATNETGSTQQSCDVRVRSTSEISENGSSIGSTASSTRSSPSKTASEERDTNAVQLDFRNVLKNKVKTKKKPEFISRPRDEVVKEGSSVTFECKVNGIPPPDVTWFFGKKEIKESKYFHMSYINEVAKLEISESFLEDEGEYICKATNESGSVQETCDLMVDELGSDEETGGTTNSSEVMGDDAVAPKIMARPEDLAVLKGTKIHLQCGFSGDPRPTVTWLKNRTTLQSDDLVNIETMRETSSLTVKKAAQEDSGQYTVKVQNSLGEDSADVSVTVEDVPEPPAGSPFASNTTTTSTNLCWYGPAYDGGSQVLCYRVELCKVKDMKWKTLTSKCEHTTYNVKNLEPETEYLFRVSAENKHGFSEPCKTSDKVFTSDGAPLDDDTAKKKDQAVITRKKSKKVEDSLPFEPQEVEISKERKLTDFYELKEEIGKGRFGNVHRCIEKSTGKEYAAKLIKLKATTNKEDVRQEIELMNLLHHPKLLLLKDAFETRRELALVMEHIGGGELFERIIENDFITEKDGVHYIRQICEGVKYMHTQSVLHLDLKPENVLCVNKNSTQIKLIDFGLARKYDPKENLRVMFGTPEFVAPEVINYEEVGPATDMWSVGVICYVLLSGLSPFMGDNPSETFVNVTKAQFDFEDEQFDELSQDAKDFIEKLLVKSTKERMKADDALGHPWLAQDTKTMKSNKLSTKKLKAFLARRKWQREKDRLKIREVDSEAMPEPQMKLSEPIFTEKLPSEPIKVQEGDVCKLEVKVCGEPTPDVQWFKDGTKLKRSRHYVTDSDGDTFSLTIQSATIDDDAEYRCKAINSEGEAECFSELYVESSGTTK